MEIYNYVVKAQENYIVSFLQNLSSVQGVLYVRHEELMNIQNWYKNPANHFLSSI